MTGSYLQRFRSWAFRGDRDLWSIYHELKNNVAQGRVSVPDEAPAMNRKGTPGNMLVAAILEILNLRQDVQFKDDRITSVIIERDEARGLVPLRKGES